MRHLASIRLINNISSIPNADAIQYAHVDGWNIVIKKEEFNVNDLCIYVEVDSWVPHSLAPFLTQVGQEPKEFNGVKGERLRTKKLRGCLSQGLLLPLSLLDGLVQKEDIHEGLDVSSVLNIQKYERELPLELVGVAKGSIPSLIPSTSLERVQNLSPIWHELKIKTQDTTWTITEKLNGVACTYYLNLDGEFHVCSSNLDLFPSDSNVYWKVAHMYGMEALMNIYSLKGFAIQGEVIGQGVDRDQYKVPLDFYVYSIYDVRNSKYLLPSDIEFMCNELGLKTVPVLNREFSIGNHSIASLLEIADGKSVISNSSRESHCNNSSREGIVLKSNTIHDLKFKVISNKWLLKYE